MWDLYRRYPEMIQRVDAARYMLLHHFGGLYADFDVECVRPLDPCASIERCCSRPIAARVSSNDLMLSVPRPRL